jgi:hypothetical protein
MFASRLGFLSGAAACAGNKELLTSLLLGDSLNNAAEPQAKLATIANW